MYFDISLSDIKALFQFIFSPDKKIVNNFEFVSPKGIGIAVAHRFSWCLAVDRTAVSRTLVNTYWVSSYIVILHGLGRLVD